MKRIGNIFDKVCTLSNIEIADYNARKGKHHPDIAVHDKHHDSDNLKLLEFLKNGTYKTSKYTTFKIYEPKERIIYKLPYYPDRIALWSLMLLLEPIWTNIFIAHTYSCIKGRGIHKLLKDLKKELKQDIEGTKYCLKMDIKKFYPSINHDILKVIIRKKIKDRKLLCVLDEIIDSTDGIPIGNYLSLFFANLYLTYFDHWLLEEVKVKHYFRYADDIVILSRDKDFLHKVLILVKLYFGQVLKLQLKPNYLIFKVEDRGIDFVGYKFYHDYTLLRKSVKYRLFRCIEKYCNGKVSQLLLLASLLSYFGWLKFCNSKKLLSKIQNDCNLYYSNWVGIDYKISKFYNKNVKLVNIIPYNKYFKLQFIYRNKKYSVNSCNLKLYNLLSLYKLPFNIKIKKL